MNFINRNSIFLLLFLFSYQIVHSQEEGKGIIEGRIFNSATNEPVPFASIVIWGTNIGSVSDLDGRFLFTGIKPGYVELRASAFNIAEDISIRINQ